MTTLRELQMTFETGGGEQVTVRLGCDPADPKSFAAVYRTKEDATKVGAKPDCKVKLNDGNDGRIEVVSRGERGRRPPMKNDPGCIMFKDGSWWCPGDDDGIG